MEENQDIPADCLIILVLEGEQGRLAGTILLCGTPSPRDCSPVKMTTTPAGRSPWTPRENTGEGLLRSTRHSRLSLCDLCHLPHSSAEPLASKVRKSGFLRKQKSRPPGMPWEFRAVLVREPPSRTADFIGVTVAALHWGLVCKDIWRCVTVPGGLEGLVSLL